MVLDLLTGPCPLLQCSGLFSRKSSVLDESGWSGACMGDIGLHISSSSGALGENPLQTLLSPKEQCQLKGRNRSAHLSLFLAPPSGQVWITNLSASAAFWSEIAMVNGLAKSLFFLQDPTRRADRNQGLGNVTLPC